MRVAYLTLALLLSACGPAGLPARVVPQPAASPQAPAPVAPVEEVRLPGAWPGRALEPGQRLIVPIRAPGRSLMIMANPSGETAGLSVEVAAALPPTPQTPEARAEPTGFGRLPLGEPREPREPTPTPEPEPTPESRPSAPPRPAPVWTPPPSAVAPLIPVTQPVAGQSPSPTVRSSPKPPPYATGFGGLGARVPLTSSRRRVLAAAEPRVGERHDFWVNSGDTTLQGDERRRATVRLVTPHALVLLDDQADNQVPMADLERLAEAFETHIRPPLTAAFGEEDIPGVDGQARLFIVVSPHVGEAEGRSGMVGYFWSRDLLPAGGDPGDTQQHSNEKEVLFLSTRLFEQPEVTAMGSLAHEYQHLLTYQAKRRSGSLTSEDTWLDEGFSMLAMDVAGYGLSGGDPYAADEIAAFQRDPAAYSLTDWSGNPNGYSYGLSYMVVRYLVERFGIGLVKEVLASRETGVAALDEVLRRKGLSFTQVFLDWAIATRPDAPGGAFSLSNESGLPGTQVRSLQASSALMLRPWGVTFLEVEGPPAGTPSVTLTGASSPLRLLGSLFGDRAW